MAQNTKVSHRRIILASKSKARRALLENAGLSILCQPSALDEKPLKDLGRSHNYAMERTALDLAQAKARAVASEREEYVIGADQILGCDEILYDKPQTLEEAFNTLSALQGKTHYLYTAVCIFKDGICDFTHISTPSLTMRVLQESEIHTYIDNVGSAVLSSVGAYQLEGSGVRLFTDIEGQYFDILGLPLLPVLKYFRSEDVLEF